MAGALVKTGCKWLGASNTSIRKVSSFFDPCPRKKFMNLKCKVALITGGSTGLGLAIADALLRAGVQKAVISGIDDAEGIKALKLLLKKHGQGRAEYKQLDVSNHKQFEAVYKSIVLKEGNLDILVNNAGILAENKWEDTIEINLKGVIKGVNLANEYMPSQKNKGGCVINNASIAGFDPFYYVPVYASTKHAVVGLTKCFDENSFNKNKVRVVSICPGVTVTDLVQKPVRNLILPEVDNHFANLVKTVPVQTADSVGRGAVYLAQYGPSGSCWSVEDSLLSRINPPDSKSYRTKVMDL